MANPLHYRLSIEMEERGQHVVRFPVPTAPASSGSPAFDRCYILASKAGQLPALEEEFHWAATYFLQDLDEIVAIVEDSNWPFESPEACFAVGLLEVGKPAPRVSPELGEFAGITLRAERSKSPKKLEVIEAQFEPERDLLLEEVRPAYQKYYAAYRDIDGYDISFQATRGMACPPVALTYGEAHFLPTYRLLEMVGVRSGDLLVDLGSGTGRLVLAAVLGFPGLQAWGIEVLKPLHDAARLVSDHALGEGPERARLRLTLGDLRTEDWSRADVVVVMTLCFPEDLLLDVQRLALRLQSGSRIVAMHATFGELLFRHPGPDLDEADEEDLRWQQLFRPLNLRSTAPHHAVPSEMSFGETSLYVYERTNHQLSECCATPSGPSACEAPFSLDSMD